MNEWISVDDRLPGNENPANIRILTFDGRFVQEQIFNTLTMHFLTRNLRVTDRITHWMPLPKPPEKP